jgi:hypothetical protein
MNNFDKFLIKALDKMFQTVGFEKFDKEFTEQHNDWYSQRTWSKDQSENFKKWFIAEAKKDLKFNTKMCEKTSALYLPQKTGSTLIF